MKVRSVFLLSALLAFLLLGCSFSLGTTPTDTPLPPPPTDTPLPAPTDTPVSAAPATTAPTTAPEPTDTPVTAEAATPTRAAIARPTAAAADTSEPLATNTAATPEAMATEKSTSGMGGVVKRPGTAVGDQPVEGTVFDFRSHTAWIGDDGSISIVGEVVNVSDQTIDTVVEIETVLTDQDGNIIQGDFGSYLDRPIIYPGETSSFWVLILPDSLEVDPDTITDYELTLWITEEPSPDVELNVLDAEAYIEDDYFYIDGTVQNQTDLTYAALAVYSTLYDANDEVVNVTVDIIELDVPLGPGEETQFTGYFTDHFEEAESFYVVVSGYTSEATGGTSDEGDKSEGGLRSADGILEITSHTGWIDEYGYVNIVGEAENIAREPVNTLVLVEALLTDADGNLIEGQFTTYLNRPVIFPDETSSFWLSVAPEELGVDPDILTDYELVMWISDELSPDVELEVLEANGYEDEYGYNIEGTVGNNTDLSFVVLAVYSTLYDANGNVINVTTDIIELDYPLEPNEKTDFYGYFPDFHEEVGGANVVVTGYTAEAIQ